MAVVFDAASSATWSGTTGPTHSHTTSGTNRAIFFLVGHSDTASTITYNGTGLTSAGTVTNTYTAVIYKLSNPTSGSNSCVFTTGASSWGTLAVISVTGAHQTTASLTGTAATATGTSTTPSASVSSGSSNELVLDVVQYSSDVTSATAGTGQTRRTHDYTTVGAATSSEAGTGASVTMDWTIDALVNWAQVGVSVVEAAGGGLGIPIIAHHFNHNTGSNL